MNGDSRAMGIDIFRCGEDWGGVFSLKSPIALFSGALYLCYGSGGAENHHIVPLWFFILLFFEIFKPSKLNKSPKVIMGLCCMLAVARSHHVISLAFFLPSETGPISFYDGTRVRLCE